MGDGVGVAALGLFRRNGREVATHSGSLDGSEFLVLHPPAPRQRGGVLPVDSVARVSMETHVRGGAVDVGKCVASLCVPEDRACA